MESVRVNYKLDYDSYLQSDEAVAEVALDGRWLRTNQALCQLLGYSAQELQTMRVRDVTHPEDRALSVNIVDQALRHYERPQQELKRYVRKDGQVVWTLLQTTLKRDHKGEPTYFLSILEDVTDRIIHEPLAQVLTARMRSLQEQERQSIARALHDQLGQSLAALKFESAWLKNKLPQRLQTHITHLDASLESILNSLRSIWKSLSPAILEELGLEPALDWLLQEYCGLQGITWKLVRAERTLRLDARVRLGLFRLCQAGILLLRQGQAEHIEVHLHIDEKQISLELQWQGTVDIVSQHPSHIAMHDHAQQLNGTLKFYLEERKIILTVPHSDASEDLRKVPPHWE